MPEDNGAGTTQAMPGAPTYLPTIRERAHVLVTYHQPDADGMEAISKIRKATEDLIVTIAENCPKSADRSAAIRSARLAMMQANAAIVVPQVEL